MIAQLFNGCSGPGCSSWRIIAAIVGLLVLIASHQPIEAAESLKSTAATKTISQSKVIYERDSDGRVKIERKVAVDSDGSFVNDGDYREWDPDGMLIAEGHFARGKHVGRWTRWHNRDDAEVLATPPFDQFQAPFVSRARFVEGQMDGEWTIADARGRKCSRVTLNNGVRAGPATLWLPDGKILRDMNFLSGLPSGDLRELGPGRELKIVASYVDGNQVMNKLTRFPESEFKHVEARFLSAATTMVERDNFWQVSFAKFAVQERLLRDGVWRSWYSNGQLQCEGNYRFGHKSGTFTWWHANGIHAVEGEFADGRPDGDWTWWHANGQKAAEAQFSRGAVVSHWRHWASDGQVVEGWPNMELNAVRARTRSVWNVSRSYLPPR